MKKDTHPEYQEVVFQDSSSDFKFVTRSTMKPTDTIVMEDGKTYPLVKIKVRRRVLENDFLVLGVSVLFHIEGAVLPVEPCRFCGRDCKSTD